MPLQVYKIWRDKEKHSGKAKNVPIVHDNTQITILLYNFGPFIPALTKGDNYAIGELRNGKHSTAESLIHLVHCVQRVIAILVDNYDESTAFKFAKLYIKDDFWRLAVSDKYAWNFCYVIPQSNKVKILKISR